MGFILFRLIFSSWKDTQGMQFTLELLGLLIGLAVAWRNDTEVIYILTAFVGAYCLVRGISLFTGSFPNEMELYG